VSRVDIESRELTITLAKEAHTRKTIKIMLLNRIFVVITINWVAYNFFCKGLFAWVSRETTTVLQVIIEIIAVILRPQFVLVWV
jgi:hypothetical protein